MSQRSDHRSMFRANIVAAHVSRSAGMRSIRIGDVGLDTPIARFPDKVPVLYGPRYDIPSELSRHLLWLVRKIQVGQDVFLIGPPGPFRRRLAMWCCELLGREVEYVALSRDTTENDLKQRREISNGSLTWVDQAPVRAALEGRVLILDGIEKAERNVLPTLNNLLENREMQLQDGRFLYSPSRSEKEHLSSKSLVQVSPDFRVVALGVPVPAFPGYLLDPPLRSRFQAHYVGAFTAAEHLNMLRRDFPTMDQNLATMIVGCLVSLRELWIGALRGENSFKICPCPEDLPRHIATLVSKYPALQGQVAALIHRVYPAALLQYDAATLKAVEHALQAQGFNKTLAEVVAFDATPVPLAQVTSIGAHFLGVPSPVHVPMGTFRRTSDATEPISFFLPEIWNCTLSCVIQDFSVGRDVAIIGEAGEGKTTFVRALASTLHFATHEIFTMQCFKDMTDRDLVQRRVTDENGNTYWKDTPLLDAAQRGGLLILDGIHRLTVSALSAIHGLLFDRDLWLPDGTHLMSEARFQQVERNGLATLRRVSNNFRVIALGTPQSTKPSEQWITAELLPLFSWHQLPALKDSERLNAMICHSPQASEAKLQKLLHLSRQMQNASRGDSSWKLSLRQLLRLGNYCAVHPNGLPAAIRRTVMSVFWPTSMRESFEELLAEHFEDENPGQTEKIRINVSETTLNIGGTCLPLANPRHPELVPQTLFFENSRHLRQLREMARDLALGNKHLLLIGNQGTGKNKLVDHLLQLLHWEREYIQLHRDTTVQSLTVHPTLEGGVIGWQDSPLVRAARLGRTLVCDEADKAPTEVVCVFKGLVEDGEMHLSDGRRLLREGSGAGGSDSTGSGERQDVIPIHPDFRLFVLANRPGFPFLGNDFFRECGDVFAVHVVENPDHDSEVEMLRMYAPDVPLETLQRLSAAFTEVRGYVDDGTLQYPYSTRELVNIAKHLQLFPQSPLQTLLAEVFDFERHDYHAREIIDDIFSKYGIFLKDIDAPDQYDQFQNGQSLSIMEDHMELRKAKTDMLHSLPLREILDRMKEIHVSQRLSGSPLATRVHHVFSASVLVELLKRTQRDGISAVLQDLVHQLDDVVPDGTSFVKSLLQDAWGGRNVIEQLQDLLRTEDAMLGHQAEIVSEFDEVFQESLAREILTSPDDQRGVMERLPLASEGPRPPSIEDLLSVMPAAERELAVIGDAASHNFEAVQPSGKAMLSGMRLAVLAQQLAAWQRAASASKEAQENDVRSANGETQDSGDIGGNGGGDANGGAGSGGSGSGQSSGQGGAQGGNLQSDGRGGFSEDALMGALESTEEVQLHADAVEAKVREINERIGINEQLNQMRLGDPRAIGEYDNLVSAVARQLAELRIILDAAEAKEKEREWLNNQSSGELDDNKLIDGVTGEKLIYRRRGEPDRPAGLFQRLPKRLVFVVDVSASMARFNAQDGRLDRMSQTVAMVLEALHGKEHKFEYAVVGHSGNSPSIPFVEFGRPPQSRVERSRIIQAMASSASIAASGDTTLQATELAIQAVVEKEADDYLVFVLSDANLGGYGITPAVMGETLMRNEKVKAYAVFLSEPLAARHLQDGLPVGRGYVCLNMADLPTIFKEIFVSAAAD